MECLIAIAKWIGEFLNSNFTAALGGAFFGALAAKKIARDQKYQDEVGKEVRAINSALAICSLTTRQLFYLKKLRTKKIIEEYRRQRDLWIKTQNKAEVGKVELKVLANMFFPLETLKKEIEEKIFLEEKTYIRLLHLEETLRGLDVCFSKRNETIERMLEKLSEGVDIYPLYFGTKDEKNRIDQTYLGVMEGLEMRIDNGMYYAKKICEDLKKHGDETLKKIIEEFPKMKKTLKINEIDFSYLEMEIFPQEPRNTIKPQK